MRNIDKTYRMEQVHNHCTTPYATFKLGNELIEFAAITAIVIVTAVVFDNIGDLFVVSKAGANG